MRFIAVFLLFFSICYAGEYEKYLSEGQYIEYVNNVPVIINDSNERNILVKENKEYTILFSSSKSIKTNVLKNIFGSYEIYHNLPAISVNTNLSTIRKLVKRMPRSIKVIQEITPKLHNDNNAPNDPYFQYQWYLYNPTAVDGVNYDLRYLDYLKYIKEHNIKRDFGTHPPVIAIMDSGFYFNSPEFANRVYINTLDHVNGRDDDGNGYVDDYMGVSFSHPECNKNLDTCISKFYNAAEANVTHGLAMASVMAANANNKTMIAGLLPEDFRILPLSAENKQYTAVDQYLKAYDYTLDMKNMGVNIIAINMSIGGKYDAVEHDYIRKLNNAGIMIIASAGNGKSDIDKPGSNAYPAALSSEMPNVISVGALDSSGNIAVDFSNFGNKNVSIYMPGKDITTIVWSPNGLSVAYTDGTSQASAIMSGVFGIAYWLYPNMSVNDLRTKILSAKHAYYSGYMSNMSKEVFYFNTVGITDFMDDKIMPEYKYGSANNNGIGGTDTNENQLPIGLRLFAH